VDLQKYDFDILYIPGKTNIPSDTLLCLPGVDQGKEDNQEITVLLLEKFRIASVEQSPSWKIQIPPILEYYDPPHFSHLPYPSSTTPELVSFDLRPVTKSATKPQVIFPSTTPPELMGKQPLPLNPPSLSPLEDLPPRPEWTRPTMPEQTRPATPQWTSPSQVVMI